MNENQPPNPSAPPQAGIPQYYEEPTSSSGIPWVRFIIGAVVLLLIIIVAFIFVFSRFQSKKNEQVTLTWWGVWEDPAVFASLISEFNRQNPRIKVKYERQDIKNLGKYVERLRTRIDNGTGPDIYRYHNSWVPQIKSFLLPLPSDVVASTELDTKYFPVVKEDLKRGGAYLGVPLNIDGLALFVNNSLLKAAGESPPTNWDDLLQAALRLTVKNQGTGAIETSGVALGTFDNIAHATDIISLLFIQNGAKLTDLAGQNRKNAEQALSYYTFFAKGDGKVWDENMQNSRLAFISGKLAMYFGFSWEIPEIKVRNPDLNFSIIPVPRIPSGRSDTIASYWVEGVSARSKHPKEAFELLKFLSRRDNLEKLYSERAKLLRFGVPYPRQDMADLLRNDALLYPFMQSLSNAQSTPFSSDTYDDALNTAFNAYLGNAVRSVLSDSTSVESSIDTLAQGVNQIMSKYEK